ncbi:MAG TPA: tRNA (N(6)-L-threonylcarbamoyladenosine(37)-C(2))-methylthiotransferase MtaB [Clostridiales bacterium]|jgi:threonylcarbamoyladenosine tRNA methylthiotransferase MtaB|nr:tRNA (N(6)-L-threonylcarbamoyladenosine(37)-C(2))-methylthiotransferase MtaB [Clostridiales bacterium]
MKTAPVKRVAFYTLGCKTNQYDTEAMQEQFVKSGYRVVGFQEDSDVYVVNTCTVTNLGDRKSRQVIRKAHRTNPNAVIAVVGCYAQQAAEEVLSIPGVRVAVGTKNRNRIVEYVETAEATGSSINAVEDIMKLREFEDTPIEAFDGKTRAVLKIQEGCNRFCSYCIIPYARGPIRSRKPKSVLEEVQRLAKAGFKEIVLTGIHIASYGADLKTTDLLGLLEDIHKVDGIQRIRLGSIEPTLLTDEFVGTVRQLSKVCRHYHISLQSGCDATLKRMNRRYTTAQFREIVERLRSIIPDTAVTTDIMVGFPGETEEEFVETCDFVEAIRFSKIHVFQYSPRRGTPAASFENQVPAACKEQRSRKLISLGRQLEREFMKQFIGRQVIVLFEEEHSDRAGYYEGYTDQYVRVTAQADSELEGRLLPVMVQSIENDSLTGQIVWHV